MITLTFEKLPAANIAVQAEHENLLEESHFIAILA